MADIFERSLAEAAEARRSIYRARKDRPQQRCVSPVGGKFTAAFRMASEVRFMTGGDVNPASGMVPTGGAWVNDPSSPTDVDSIFFVGLASSTNSPYEMYDSAGPYTELVAPGAFQQTLSLGDKLDVPLVIEHDPIRRLARTTIPAGQPGNLQLAETDIGLVMRAQMDPRDPDVAYIVPKLQSGLISEASFRFQVTSGEWSPDYSQYVIHAADLQRGDVSIVAYGANPNTLAALAGRAASGKLSARERAAAVMPLDEKAQRVLFEQLRAKFDVPKPRALGRAYLVRDEDLK